MENSNNNIPVNQPYTKVIGTNTIKATPKEIAKQVANSKSGEAPSIEGKMTGLDVTKTKVAGTGIVQDAVIPATTEPATKPETLEQSTEPTKSEEPLKAEEADDKATARFTALAKKERKLELDKSEHLKSVKEFESKKAAHDKDIQEFIATKNNPKMMLEVLEKLGVPFTKLAEYVLNPEKIDPEYENKRFREEYENEKKSKAEADKANTENQAKANIDNYKSGIKTFIDGNNEAYELIVKQNKYDLVYDVMNEQFQKDGTEMDKTAAAQMVEDFLTEQAKELLKAKKLSNMISVSSSNESTKTENKKDKEIKATTNQPQIAKNAVTTKTLTNLKATLITDTRNEAKTDQERRARALAAFKTNKSK